MFRELASRALARIPAPNVPGVNEAAMENVTQITEPAYYRWKEEYGGLRVDQAKGLEKVNARLKRMLADAVLDKPFFGSHATN
jgi:putative transposase